MPISQECFVQCGPEPSGDAPPEMMQTWQDCVSGCGSSTGGGDTTGPNASELAAACQAKGKVWRADLNACMDSYYPSGAPPGGEGEGEVPDFNSWFSPYSGPRSFDVNLGSAPRFSAPRFSAPTAESALNEPGYQFRLKEGERALENSAAGRGVLRTGGTLKDILSYGQNFAAQEYGNVWDRAARKYDFDYRAALGEWSPTFLEWQTKAQASQRAKELGNQQAWQEYMFGQNMNFNWLQSLLEAGKA